MQGLVVLEDEPGIGTVVFRALSLARVRIDGAAGRSGLEMARSGHHDLVLLDLMRSGPGGGGPRRADRQGRQADAAGDVHADGEGTSGSIAHQATTKLREVARS
jgi:CheY-like chemotaxis protein